jgi:uncharacterized protein YndB with AHSA1/START domain
MSEVAYSIEPGRQEIVMTRTFQAPRDLVFRTMTDPALIPRWWGPRRLTTTVEEMDPRPGGRWRYVQREPGGGEHAFHGVYHDVSAPERLVLTFEYEGVPGHVLLQTVTLEERGGRTRLVDQSVFQSVADRDAMVRSGMESGATESMERLGELLEGPPPQR